ncbi:MAG: hypothetical protein K8I03_06235 [Ignavibacteria bacterium]|nr:hypothetical protein [Ignavibacteria bacterium]
MNAEEKNRSLEHHFKRLKAENYTDSFPAVENWLYKTNIKIENQKTERKLQKMKNFFFAHKLRLVYTVIALAVVIGACNMPVTQTESAGQMITLTVPADNTGFHEKLNSLPWIKNAQVSSNENTNNGVSQTLYTIILPNATEEDAKAYCKEIEAFGNITTIRMKSLNYDLKRPLYSAALDNFFSIKVDATGMSDQELESEVQKQLKEQGAEMKISFTTGPDGRRDIHLENPESDKNPKSFEMTIDEDNGQEKVKLLQRKADPDKFKGKSDDEIRKMIKDEFKSPGLKDSDIIITRDGDKVQVKVESNQKDIRGPGDK